MKSIDEQPQNSDTNNANEALNAESNNINPWVPQSSNGVLDTATHDGNNDLGFNTAPFTMPCPERRIKTSEEHIASLEGKLKKLKGRVTEEPSSRELLKCLSQARQDASYHYPVQSSEAFIEELVMDEESPLAQLQRRLHPDRQALNTDELLHLVENDLLQKVSAEINEQQNSNESQKIS